MPRKKSTEMRDKIHSFHEENEFHNMTDNTRYRARSVTVGTGYNGMIEIGLRNEFYHLWTIMQPVEAVEIMEQLAAACGIEIAMRPKQNFTSWREWDTTEKVFVKGSNPDQLEGHQQLKMLNEARKDIDTELQIQRLELEKLKEIKKIKDDMKKIKSQMDDIEEEKTKLIEGGQDDDVETDVNE
jgi:hypothetical protein